jgi:cytosine/creatinine deaminase
LKATRVLVVRRGKTIARTPEKVTSLFVQGRPPTVALNFSPGSIA